MVAFGVYDGSVSVWGVVSALRLIRQIRSCFRKHVTHRGCYQMLHATNIAHIHTHMWKVSNVFVPRFILLHFLKHAVLVVVIRCVYLYTQP